MEWLAFDVLVINNQIVINSNQ